MIATVFVEPHERGEALEAYKDRLSKEQVAKIEDAPESAIIKLSFGMDQPGTFVEIIEEG